MIDFVLVIFVAISYLDDNPVNNWWIEPSLHPTFFVFCFVSKGLLLFPLRHNFNSIPDTSKMTDWLGFKDRKNSP